MASSSPSNSKNDKTLSESDLLADAFNDFSIENADEKDEKVKEETMSIQDALKMLNDTTSTKIDETLLPNEEDLEKMFHEFAANFAQESSSNKESVEHVMPVLESMMKSVLSKELLYPPLKDLSDKYPDWLAENRQKLSEKDFDNYNKQFTVTQSLVAVFEAQDGEPEFEKVFQLMQQMQTFGHPPKDLIGNSDAFQAQLPPASGIPDCPVQ